MTDIEVVTGGALAIPRPNEVVDVYGLCASVEAHLGAVDDIEVLDDAKARLAAISEYVSLRNKDGVAKLSATIRLIEIRIGDLMPPAPNGGDRRSDQFSPGKSDLPFSPKQASDFRAMSANKPIVTAVIDNSTDADPATHKKVMAAIKEQKSTPGPKPKRSPLADEFEKQLNVIFTAGNRLDALANDDRLRANAERIAQMIVTASTNITAVFCRVIEKTNGEEL